MWQRAPTSAGVLLSAKFIMSESITDCKQKVNQQIDSLERQLVAD